MIESSLYDIDESNSSQAVMIAPRIWWVGHYIPDDPFQCHAYLIENGDQSILIDPGSRLTFCHTLKKIESVIPFASIRYFVCHHQDPDITACLSLIDQMVCRDDCKIISHWRAIALLKHYDLKLDFMCVEKNNWHMNVDGRHLEFIFTPYLHFPGAFCTFDPATGVLFSSDLFGGFTDEWRLVARDEKHFESIRSFHEHYMPSREILYHGMIKIEKYPIRTIAPQHGSIIPEHLVQYMINQLKNTDCGLYLMTQTNTEINRLSQLNKMFRQFMQIMVRYRDFSRIAQLLLEQVKQSLSVDSLEFYAWDDEDKNLLHLVPESLYRGKLMEKSRFVYDIEGIDLKQWMARFKVEFVEMPHHELSQQQGEINKARALVIPLFTQETGKLHALAAIILGQPINWDSELLQMIKEISLPLGVAVEREMLQRRLDTERQCFYEISTRDSLTNLYNRTYMNEAVQRLMAIHDRDASASVIVASFDIDHFKRVNDTFGHNAGDTVLKEVARVLNETTRRGDIPVRMGGEEFSVFMTGSDSKAAGEFGERVRQYVAKLRFDIPMEDLCITMSCGIAKRGQGESLEKVLERSDKALYKAKRTGRDRVCFAPEIP